MKVNYSGFHLFSSKSLLNKRLDKIKVKQIEIYRNIRLIYRYRILRFSKVTLSYFDLFRSKMPAEASNLAVF